ncbi:PREDICTED: proline-rich protein HaeIII subfamily 1-like, partial [Chinchilla lanigera]|uniref:proline-rich protein HaeIII subfamily 1-like n=1 Tax=Chinchilla lanigera TaxID=34839 RepID=UPI000697BDB1
APLLSPAPPRARPPVPRPPLARPPRAPPLPRSSPRPASRPPASPRPASLPPVPGSKRLSERRRPVAPGPRAGATSELEPPPLRPARAVLRAGKVDHLGPGSGDYLHRKESFIPLNNGFLSVPCTLGYASFKMMWC